MCYFRKKYVSFLSCFWPNIYFPCNRIFSLYSSYFWAYLKACYPYILQVLSINKIESLNFSLVLKRTLWTYRLFRDIHQAYQSDLYHQFWRPRIPRFLLLYKQQVKVFHQSQILEWFFRANPIMGLLIN